MDNTQLESFLIKVVVRPQTYQTEPYPQPRQIMSPRRVLQLRRRAVLLFIVTEKEMIVQL